MRRRLSQSAFPYQPTGKSETERGLALANGGVSRVDCESMRSPLPILVVDDEPADTYFLRRALKAAGIPNPVMGCGDGEEAITFLESARFGGQRPCLVFLDLKMPRMNGFEFLAWIRGHEEFADLKIVMLSSSDLPEDRERAMALGAHDYLVKFPPPQALATMIAGALADCAG